MKRMIKLLFVFILSLPVYAQTVIGNQQAIKLKVASYGATQNALLALPDDYYVTNEKHPLIIFLHGYGEIGSSSAELSKLISQGLPKVISSGKKIQAVNPLDGKLYKFITLSPQHHGWTTPAENLEFILNDFPKNYRVDTNMIYITGLSAGGQGVIQAVTYKQTLTNKFAAIVPMSPSAPEDAVLKKFTFFQEQKPSAWFFTGKSDQQAFITNTNRYNDSISKYNGGKSRITWYNGGHCCWADFYNPDWHSPDLLMGTYGLSIYEFMLTQAKGSKPEPPVITPEKAIKIFHDPTKIFKVIVVDKDGTVTSIDSVSVESEGVKMILQ